MNIGYYVNMRTVETVYRALDIPMGDMNRGKMNGVMDEEDGEIVEEEVDNIYGHDEVWSAIQTVESAMFPFQPFSVILFCCVTQLWLFITMATGRVVSFTNVMIFQDIFLIPSKLIF